MKVLKFGGTSVGSAEIIKEVLGIVSRYGEEEESAVVVLSAFSGVTNTLVQLSRLACAGDTVYLDIMKTQIESRHCTIAAQLTEGNKLSETLSQINALLEVLKDVLHGISLLKECSLRTLDLVMSFGEKLSTTVISNALQAQLKDRKVMCVDATHLIITDNAHGSASVNSAVTNSRIQQYFAEHPASLLVVTGFIGASSDGQTTTLGRGGSDYTAAIIGAALDAEEIQIWTDVDGVMTSDPRKVPSARRIESMSYEEAMEMSYFGAKILYPPTMGPALLKDIPIVIKNTFNPSCEGTRICRNPDKNHSPIRAISSVSQISLLNLQGCGMVGIVGISRRLFGALADGGINVIFISQASSEHSICFAIDPSDSTKAKAAVEKEFELEILKNQIDGVTIENSQSIIAIVGERMKKKHNIAGSIFSSIGRAGVSITAIAQGCSEHNISVIVDSNHTTTAVQAIHSAFFDNCTVISLFIVGVGLIGSTFIAQVASQRAKLMQEGKELRIVALSSSKLMYFSEDGVDTSEWKQCLESKGRPADFKEFVKYAKKAGHPNAVVVDCTSSEEITDHFEELLHAGVHIVAANKKANSGKYSKFQALRDVSKKHGRFLYETNVGAGLPVIGTLKNLLSTGDKLIKVEAILSGTLSYVFNSFTSGISFSEVVRTAQKNGYTEPDPREDLCGMDVARKLLLLARESGLQLELEDIDVEDLVPVDCRDPSLSVDMFFAKLKQSDHLYESKRKDASEAGQKLRYIASLSEGKAKVSLLSVDSSHPCFHTNGSDNVVVFTTQRYNQPSPLVIKGPGAGAEVTAAGVFADVLSLFH